MVARLFVTFSQWFQGHYEVKMSRAVARVLIRFSEWFLGCYVVVKVFWPVARVLLGHC